MSAREADVHNGRVRAALADLVRSECDREISLKFLKWFAELRALRSARSLLGDQADFLERPSGSGGPLEYEVQCAVSDLMDENGVTAEDLEKEAVDSLCRSIRNRLESYIRRLKLRSMRTAIGMYGGLSSRYGRLYENSTWTPSLATTCLTVSSGQADLGRPRFRSTKT